MLPAPLHAAASSSPAAQRQRAVQYESVTQYSVGQWLSGRLALVGVGPDGVMSVMQFT